MASVVGVGGIGAVDFLRWGPSGDMAGGRIHIMTCLFTCLVHISAWSRV